MRDVLTNLRALAQSFLKDEQGQDMVEYALVVGIIALGATATIGGVANAVGNMFTAVKTKIDTATTSITG